MLGPYGLSNTIFNTGMIIIKLDTGVITTYSLYFILSLLVLIVLVFSYILINNLEYYEYIRLFIVIYFAFLFILPNVIQIRA
jgi:NADH-ubiquinone oxidoreductase chain 5